MFSNKQIAIPTATPAAEIAKGEDELGSGSNHGENQMKVYTNDLISSAAISAT
jgi:hypothetical protein